MIVKIMGILDLLAAVLLVVLAAGTPVWWYLLFAATIIMLVKSVPFVFSGCFASFIDIGIAILFVLSIFFSLPIWILVIGIVAVAQKGFLSLI